MNITPAGLNAALNGDFDDLITALTPGGIEAQEAMGQKDLCNASRLPKRILRSGDRKQFENLGIKFLDDYDDIFVNVELPQGWKICPTDHSMWSDLVDDNGKVITQIFYKAAFYDRSAHVFDIKNEEE